MSDTEALMWTVEHDPALRSDFCNLTVVDAPIDFERLQDKLLNIIQAIPRLGQRVVPAPLGVATPEWVDVDIDVSYHLRRVTLARPGTERQLLDACALLADAPFDRDRPLWQFTVFDGLADGGGALLQKMHHTITDGVGGMKLSLQIVDFEAHPLPNTPNQRPEPRAATATHNPSLLNSARHALSDATKNTVTRTASALANTGRVITDPRGAPARIGDLFAMASSLRRQVLITERSHSDLIDDRSLQRHFELVRFPLPAAKAAARELGGSLNDLFVTFVADALGRYHRELGSAVTELRMAMPVNKRDVSRSAANEFAPSRVVVPISPGPLRARFDDVRQRLDVTKRERSLGATRGLAAFVTALPNAAIIAAARNQTRTIDFATSNLRGSPVPLFLVGSRIVANYPLGPRTGCALNISLLSYCDELHLGLNLDPAAISDIPMFLRELRAAFDEVCAQAV